MKKDRDKKLPVVFLKEIGLREVLSDPKLKRRLRELTKWEQESAKTHWVLGETLDVTRKKDLDKLVKKMLGNFEDIQKLLKNKPRGK